MKRISKEKIKRHMAKPVKDFFMEKIDLYSYRLNFSPYDAVKSIPLLSNTFNVIPDGTGLYGSAYIVKEF